MRNRNLLIAYKFSTLVGIGSKKGATSPSPPCSRLLAATGEEAVQFSAVGLGEGGQEVMRAPGGEGHLV